MSREPSHGRPTFRRFWEVVVAALFVLVVSNLAASRGSPGRYEEEFGIALSFLGLTWWVLALSFLAPDPRFRLWLYPGAVVAGYVGLQLGIREAYGYTWRQWLASLEYIPVLVLVMTFLIALANVGVPRLQAHLSRKRTT